MIGIVLKTVMRITNGSKRANRKQEAIWPEIQNSLAALNETPAIMAKHRIESHKL